MGRERSVQSVARNALTSLALLAAFGGGASGGCNALKGTQTYVLPTETATLAPAPTPTPTPTPIPEEAYVEGTIAPVVYVATGVEIGSRTAYEMYFGQWTTGRPLQNDKIHGDGAVTLEFGVADDDLTDVYVYVDGKLVGRAEMDAPFLGYTKGKFTVTGLGEGEERAVTVVAMDGSGNHSFEEVTVRDGKGITSRRESADNGPPLILVSYRREGDYKELPSDTLGMGDGISLELYGKEDLANYDMPADEKWPMARIMVFDERINYAGLIINDTGMARDPAREMYTDANRPVWVELSFVNTARGPDHPMTFIAADTTELGEKDGYPVCRESQKKFVLN